MALTSLPDVQAHVLGRVKPLDEVSLPLSRVLGLALVRDVTAAEPVPPFDNSAMDGYAVRAADCRDARADSPVRLKVVGELPAGTAPDRAVGAGEAIRIMTGAAVPPGCDGIVIVENTEADGDEVVITARAGDHIRVAGGDMVPGDLVFEVGTSIGPAHLGVLASLGMPEVPVRRRPRVGVISTGDELVPPGEPLPAGKIRESNRPMLLALVEQAACEPVDLGTVADDEEAVTRAFEQGAADCDALISSGGVSMGGEYDVVRIVLDRIAAMDWFQVAIKPAKPFAVGAIAGVPVFGLPGNPVSSLVSFEMFARPALRQMMGHAQLHRARVVAVAGEALPRRPDGKTHFDRVRVTDDGRRLVAERTGGQASNVLTAMARANGLAMLPDGEGVAEGDRIDVMLLGPPHSLRS